MKDPLRQVVRSKPLPGYTGNVVITLGCGHSMVSHASAARGKRRCRCKACGKAIAALEPWTPKKGPTE